MSLLPTLSFLRVGNPSAPHALEFYLDRQYTDFLCPYSAKIFFNAIDPILKPAFADSGKHAGKVKILIRLQPQSWHGSSTFLHEAALAVGRVAPDRFWEYAAIVFKNQGTFFDIPASLLTPIQIREKLVALVPEGVDKSKVADLLVHKTTPNGGVAVTDDLKYNSRYPASRQSKELTWWTVKLGRQNSIHVTPTAVWDGLVAGDVSSSWGEEEWNRFLSANILV
ncbi:hypothetical protein FRC10_008517 [Ceratobasidium sp. 414]|nr:hypothetical protein FRC10_008517 [Ceratobasidium sp. 414]